MKAQHHTQPTQISQGPHILFGSGHQVNRVLGVPPGATIQVIQHPEDFVRAEVTTIFTRERWMLEVVSKERGIYRLALQQTVESNVFCYGRVFRGVMQLYFAPLRALWAIVVPVVVVVEFLRDDIHLYQQEADARCANL